MHTITWEDVLGNPGGSYSAKDAMNDLGCTKDSAIDEIVNAIKRFCNEVYTGNEAKISDSDAEQVARHLLESI